MINDNNNNSNHSNNNFSGSKFIILWEGTLRMTPKRRANRSVIFGNSNTFLSVSYLHFRSNNATSKQTHLKPGLALFIMAI